ncbi:MAG: hypothetical protein PUC33_05275 [Oscillospiraceae bacterium]|nr:hypothetical protein [Oscillospiraceae bacterium]
MKKSMKKYLLVLLAISMLAAVMVFSASAAGTCAEGDHNFTYTIYNPTCTDKGYTQAKCKTCGIKINSDYKDALGHDWGDGYYSEAGSGYFYRRNCNRCSEVYTETENGNPVIFYKVEFWNDTVADTYCTDVTYTKLVEKTKSQLLYTTYVKSGSTAVYKGATPIREKDKSYGSYTFKGFEAKDAADNTVEIDLKEVTANARAVATFTGVTVYHKVTFFSEVGKPISGEVTVPHGGSIDDSNIKPFATKSEDVQYKYQFKSWSININQVYDSVGAIAQYTRIPKAYKFVYYSYDGQPMRIDSGADSQPAQETVAYGSASSMKVQLEAEARKREEKPDAMYAYKWTGKWELRNRPGFYISLDYMIVPEGTLERVEEVQITPVYVKTPVVYTLNVQILPPKNETIDSLLDITVQVTDGRGQLIAAGKTNADGIFTCSVNYSDAYYITAVTPDNRFECEGTAQFFSGGNIINKTMRLELNEDFNTRCNCICHNVLFRPLWVQILNLLYRLFGIKHVCCYDMYATIGDLLAYTK